MAVTPDGAYAYVTSADTSLVSVISTATNTVTATISTYFGPNIFGAESAPYGVAITPNGAYAYITNAGSSSVSVISTATNTITANITDRGEPYDVAITPNGTYAYVTNEGSDTVSVISTSNAITSPTPTVSPAASPSPSPTIPEFSIASLILVVVCVLAVTICAVASAHKKSTELTLIPSRRQDRRMNQKITH